MTANNGLGIAIRTLRTSAGLTLTEVSELAGISVNYLSRAENGLVHPTADWVRHVAAAIGTHLQAAA